MKTYILRDQVLEMFKSDNDLKYDYILLEIDEEHKKASYIVEDAVRFNLDYEVAIKYLNFL